MWNEIRPSHLRSKYFTAKLFHLALPNFTRRRRISLKKRASLTTCSFFLEVTAGFEPADNGVADRGLTTWLLHQRFSYSNIITKFFRFVNRKREKLLKRFLFLRKRFLYDKIWFRNSTRDFVLETLARLKRFTLTTKNAVDRYLWIDILRALWYTWSCSKDIIVKERKRFYER